MFCKKVFPTNFADFTRKTCSKDSFLIKLQSLTLSKKRFRHRRFFFVNSARFLRKPFLKNSLDGCFCINTHSVYFPSTTLCLFKIDSSIGTLGDQAKNHQINNPNFFKLLILVHLRNYFIEALNKF